MIYISVISVPDTLASFGNWDLGKLGRFSTKFVVENRFATLPLWTHEDDLGRLEQPQPISMRHILIYWLTVTADIPTCAETPVDVLEPFPFCCQAQDAERTIKSVEMAVLCLKQH